MASADDGTRAGTPSAEDLFAQALATPADERMAWLRDACRGNHALFDDVASLLAASARARTFLETPVVDATATDLGGMASRTLVGKRVGDFTLVEVLGEGGMGIVFRAEQAHPRRAVALKLIRPGLATPSTLRRFELEAEALGRLRHPGIAAIHAAGTADVGMGAQPYFAMELVEGRTLRSHLVVAKPPLEERVRLLALIAEAVQHAHQNGVIHRDLKPDNIVVEAAERDAASARPRVLDFGVARLVGEGPSERSVATEAGHMVGTLHYMSPEQVSGGTVDTRSDVFALGLIAWETLAGRTARSFGQGSLADVVRAITETDPPPLASVAPNIPKDLSLVVAKALAREPERRYASAGDLAADLRRFLRHEPVTARAPTLLYVATRFARRNRAAVVAGSVVGLLVVAGALLYVAEKAREFTRLRERDFNSSRGFEYVFDKFGVDPNSAGGFDSQELAKIIAVFETGIDELADAPQGQVKVLTKIGELLNVNANYADSKRVFERALAICDESLPRDHELRATALHGLAAGEWFVAQGDPEALRAAKAHYEEALAIRTGALGAEDSDTALTMRHLAATLRALGDTHGAERLYRRSLAIHERLHRKGDKRADATMLASGHNGLATLLMSLDQYAEAERELQTALDLMRSLPRRRIVDEARVVRNRARALGSLDRHDEADGAYREAEALFLSQLGPRHRELATTLVRRGQLALRAGDAVTAQSLGRRVLDEFDLAEGDALRKEADELARPTDG